MSKREANKQGPRNRQYAALPVAEIDGETKVLLVTSRETGRWVLPKGWSEKGLSGPDLAAKEALEEAGLLGKVSGEPFGQYTYLKWLPGGRLVHCQVEVFQMSVERLLDDWPERGQRERKWFTLAQAAKEVDEGDLANLLLLHAVAPVP